MEKPAELNITEATQPLGAAHENQIIDYGNRSEDEDFVQRGESFVHTKETP
jgi:hypothetical protein